MTCHRLLGLALLVKLLGTSQALVAQPMALSRHAPASSVHPSTSRWAARPSKSTDDDTCDCVGPARRVLARLRSPSARRLAKSLLFAAAVVSPYPALAAAAAASTSNYQEIVLERRAKAAAAKSSAVADYKLGGMIVATIVFAFWYANRTNKEEVDRIKVERQKIEEIEAEMMAEAGTKKGDGEDDFMSGLATAAEGMDFSKEDSPSANSDADGEDKDDKDKDKDDLPK